VRRPLPALAIIAIGRSAPFAYTFTDRCLRGIVLIMGSESDHGCHAFMIGPAVEAFLTKFAATRLACTVAMHIDISHGGR
jgi:hypothetical protein